MGCEAGGWASHATHGLRITHKPRVIDERSMAYGSTPFQSWHEIVMHPALQSALLAAARAPVPPPPPPGVSVGSEAEAPRGFLVLGSSIGWFPMLAYLEFVSECSI